MACILDAAAAVALIYLDVVETVIVVVGSAGSVDGIAESNGGVGLGGIALRITISYTTPVFIESMHDGNPDRIDDLNESGWFDERPLILWQDRVPVGVQAVACRLDILVLTVHGVFL